MSRATVIEVDAVSTQFKGVDALKRLVADSGH
jgi:hypothetical protein